MRDILTGRTRYATRKRLFRAPATILEVEWRRQGEHWHSNGREVECDPVDYTFWSRAQVADILNLEAEGRLTGEPKERLLAALGA